MVPWTWFTHRSPEEKQFGLRISRKITQKPNFSEKSAGVAIGHMVTFVKKNLELGTKRYSWGCPKNWNVKDLARKAFLILILWQSIFFLECRESPWLWSRIVIMRHRSLFLRRPLRCRLASMSRFFFMILAKVTVRPMATPLLFSSSDNAETLTLWKNLWNTFVPLRNPHIGLLFEGELILQYE